VQEPEAVRRRPRRLHIANTNQVLVILQVKILKNYDEDSWNYEKKRSSTALQKAPRRALQAKRGRGASRASVDVGKAVIMNVFPRNSHIHTFTARHEFVQHTEVLQSKVGELIPI
jgi:hypothetical protein